jgi:hypothetical protein
MTDRIHALFLRLRSTERALNPVSRRRSKRELRRIARETVKIERRITR